MKRLLAWYRSRTLRSRLLFMSLYWLCIMVPLIGVTIYVPLRQRLYAQLDRDLHEDIETAEEELERAPDGAVRWRVAEHVEPGERRPVERWIEVWDPAGKLLLSRPAPTGVAFSPVPASWDPDSFRTAFDEHLRVRGEACGVGGASVVIRSARSEAAFRSLLGGLLVFLLFGLGGFFGLATLGSYGLVASALGPVARMTEQARRITAERLAERLPVPNPNDEIGQLALTFNDAFARLERSFEQLRRFTADASHELRTPLTALRSVGEVGLRGPRDERAYREIIGSMLEEADRLTRLVEGLLTLARADAGRVALRREPMDLAALARAAAGHLGVLAEERRQALAVEAPAPVAVVADPVVLRQAVINLVDNAIKYTPEGGSIRIAVGDGPGGATLAVADTGPGIAPEHRERVFDRFYRVDPGRAREAGGAGLGLAIARWGVEAHGGRIELASEVGRGSTFAIVLPHGAAPAGGVPDAVP